MLQQLFTALTHPSNLEVFWKLTAANILKMDRKMNCLVLPEASCTQCRSLAASMVFLVRMQGTTPYIPYQCGQAYGDDHHWEANYFKFIQAKNQLHNLTK
jgi:hypothetical protein